MPTRSGEMVRGRRPERVQYRYVDEFEQVDGGPNPKAGVKERAAATSVLWFCTRNPSDKCDRNDKRNEISLFLCFGQVACKPWSNQKLFDFLVVGLEWVTHDKKITAVAGNRIPIDHIWETAILKESYCATATRCACIGRRAVRRTGPPDIVVPLRNSLTRRDAVEEPMIRIDVVIFEVDAL